MGTFWNKRLWFLFIRKRKNIVNIRLFNKLSDSNSPIEFDPFQKKKTYSVFKLESDSRNASRICITILGNGGLGQPRCVGLFTEFKSYLFNCGEGVGRYCREYDINTCFIKHVFITQRKWENICGLTDVYLSNKTLGVYSMSLYGPPGIEQFLPVVSSKELDTRISKKDGGYIDHTVNIDYIPLTSQKNSKYEMKKYYYRAEPDVYCYICKILERPGDLLIEKCIEFGVPIGPEILKLKHWENIVLPSGKTVYAEDVHSLSYPEKIILIVDCPSKSFLEPLVNEMKFQKYQSPLSFSSEILVFHFTPFHIFESKKYQDWMNRFHHSTKHFVLNSKNSSVSSIVVHQSVKYFNLLHPEIFSQLRDKELGHRQNSIQTNVLYPPIMMQIHLRPKQEYSWSNVVKDSDNLNIAIDGSDIVINSEEFYKKLENLKSSLHQKSLSNEDTSIYPEVLFLGTSSAASSAYRNVTAILLNISPDNSILLDCGEGTMLQFTRYFGTSVYSVLQKISCIFISHRHSDHYLGLFNLISERIKAYEIAGVPYQPVVLILPFDIHRIFKHFCEVFDNLQKAVRVFTCRNLDKKRVIFKKFIPDLEISTVPVTHCTDAWGIVVESENQWKIVYSGDAAPCQTLVDAGKDCTLLIHEASIEDDFLVEALAKKHSTPSQVIDIATKMNAQYTIMTHFSKRYLGFPILPEGISKENEIVCAVDFMKVRKSDLPLLSLFTPVMKSLFQGQLQEYQAFSSNFANFENSLIAHLQCKECK